MAWLSMTTCTPRHPRRRLRPPLLRNMRLSLGWLPSRAKHENLERVLQWRAKKYMWGIHKCYHSSLGHSKSKWALPIAILHSRNLPRSAPNDQDVRHAYIHIWAKLSHHCLQTSPHGLPRTRLLFIPPSSRHTASDCLPPPGAHKLHSRGTLQPNLALRVGTVIALCHPTLCYRLGCHAGNIKDRLEKNAGNDRRGLATGSRHRIPHARNTTNSYSQHPGGVGGGMRRGVL